MRKYWLIIALVVIVALGVGGYYALKGPMLYARIGSTYAAKQTCSCVFISGRTLAACQADLPGGANSILKLEVKGHQIEASAYGIVHASATYEEGYGCRVDG
jgi:hypothetical protein